MTRQELIKVVDDYKEKIKNDKDGIRQDLVNESALPDGVTPEAYHYMLELAVRGDLEITEAMLKQFHVLCSGKGEVSNYRTVALYPEWAKHTPPAPEDLDHYMKHFIGQMQISGQMFHPIEFAAICHKRVLEICPFETGNEAVAMLVLNLMLIGNGYEGIASFKNKASDYWASLVKAQHPSQPDIDGFITFIANRVLEIEKEKCHQLGI